MYFPKMVKPLLCVTKNSRRVPQWINLDSNNVIHKVHDRISIPPSPALTGERKKALRVHNQPAGWYPPCLWGCASAWGTGPETADIRPVRCTVHICCPQTWFQFLISAIISTQNESQRFLWRWNLCPLLGNSFVFGREKVQSSATS